MGSMSYDEKLTEVKTLSQELGKRREECLIGEIGANPETLASVYKLVQDAAETRLGDLFGEEETLERLAAEGVSKSIIRKSDINVARWRIESKARSCACALMDAKRKDAEGLVNRDKVYKETYATIRSFAAEAFPDDPELGYSFARPIMDAADAEVKAFQQASNTASPAANEQEMRRLEARRMAEQLGKRLEDCLIGDPAPEDHRVKEAHDLVAEARIHELDRIFGEKRTLEKVAAEGVATAIIKKAHHNVLRYRNELKARSCASALMSAKRTDHEGVMLRGSVYNKAYGSYHSYIGKIMPEDPDLGASFGKAIMEAADKEVKASWKATNT